MKFREGKGPLEPRILSEYLYLLEGCIAAAADLKLALDPRNENRFDDEIDNVKKTLRSVQPLDWNDYFQRDSSELITIERIQRQSPLEITATAVISVLVLAVVLSGGKIKFGSVVEAELPPLGKGIKSLRNALGLDKKVKPAFSIQTIEIKLSKEEYGILMEQDPSEKGKGGFQNFLIELQKKINNTTRELWLSDRDLDRIMRYKKDPKKGGFQNRFSKIFGRHFPDE